MPDAEDSNQIGVHVDLVDDQIRPHGHQFAGAGNQAEAGPVGKQRQAVAGEDQRAQQIRCRMGVQGFEIGDDGIAVRQGQRMPFDPHAQ